jgi:hydroxypyruvate reductase
MSATEDLAGLAREILAAALAAAAPESFTREAITQALGPGADEPGRRYWIIATGKAAHAMAGAAVETLAARGSSFAGGLVVAADSAPAPHPALESLVGDHPVPGDRSAQAAERLGVFCDGIADEDAVLALISGGTSSLIGAPVEGVPMTDLARLHELLLASGLDITRANIVRKRFSRWGAGRLAAALAPARVYPIILSDVPGDDPAAVASGPCSPDAATARDVELVLREAGIANRLPLSLGAYLGAVRSGDLPETPKAGSPVFASVRPPVVGGNRSALEAAARRAHELGVGRVLLDSRPLAGDATAVGRAIARAVLGVAPGTVLLHGGETTVALPADHGSGGRNQQLALAAAEVLGAPAAPAAALLAVGTDGRDGPTDAAGAFVTNATWQAIGDAGISAPAALERCDAYPALDAAAALLRTGPTGTNVADIVIAIRAGIA